MKKGGEAFQVESAEKAKEKTLTGGNGGGERMDKVCLGNPKQVGA